MSIDSGALSAFFHVAFGRQTGYVGFATLGIEGEKPEFKEAFFEFPRQLEAMIEWIDRVRIDSNVYFCPQLLETRARKKDNVKLCTNIWSDLDTCTPDKLLTQPTVIVESSPGRFQALWCLEEPLDPISAEDVARRIAYFHAGHGADRSGWDLTQLLRVPHTYNFKYSNNSYDAPVVKVIGFHKAKYRPTDFAIYPEVRGTKELTLPMPEVFPTDEPVAIMQRLRYKLNPSAFGLFSTEPNKDWSGPLWRLHMFCFEAGMTREEVFVISKEAACNKYKRDNKPDEYLWRDVCRAYLRHQENVNSIVTSSELSDIITDGEMRGVKDAGDTFVEQYVRWASGVGDAAPQYHQGGAFVILSSLLSGSIRIPTSWGNILPNLWFMILGDTTLTRKSTAMDMAMDMVSEVDDETLLATDGSIEGLMSAMMLRPGKPSVFLRDEFSGLLDAMTKKDYMAGTAELLTKLYDGKPMKRILRKEIIDIKRPILIIFAGGIKTKVQSLLSFEHVSSGFIPRFLFLTAESQVSKVRPLGPPSIRDMGEREFIMARVRSIGEFYGRQVPMQMQGNPNITLPGPMQWDAELTPDAWKRYNKLEKEMLDAGVASDRSELMVPLYSRLTVSMLKAASLLAASRQRDEKVLIEEVDICRAMVYGQEWRRYANDVLNGIGKNTLERDLDRVLGAILKNPGISRSKLMQNYHLTARTADATFSTLEQRGQIVSTRMGTAQVFHPLLAVGE